MKILLLAGEESGAIYARQIRAEVLKRHPDAEIRGYGDYGFEIGDLAVFGIWAVVRKIGYFLRVKRTMKRAIDEWRPDAICTIDYPGLNLRLAAYAKARGVKAVHVVCPQVWAWHQGRVPKIEAALDRLCCFLPFEPAIFKPGFATFVGHPLVDEMAPVVGQRAADGDGSLLLAVLPGSRVGEIEKHLSTSLEAVEALQREQPTLKVVIPAANDRARRAIGRGAAAFAGRVRNLEVVDGGARDVLRQADAAIVASGTATFEAALGNCPFVLVYRVSALLAAFLRRAITGVKHVGLINVIAEKAGATCPMPELLQENFTVDNLLSWLRPWLTDRAANDAARRTLAEAMGLLKPDGLAISRIVDCLLGCCIMMFSTIILASTLAFDAGADLRIRQELMQNVPGLPNGGLLLRARRTGFANHMRFRPRVWGEVKWATQNWGNWRIYTRFTDEMRWCPEPYKNKYTFPSEVILDNLFIEGKGIFDGFLDLKIGRQDFYGLYGLDHIFVDGTPGDGSRTTYGDMAGFTLNFTEESKLDLFALYDFDDSDVRWGTDRSKHTNLAGLDPACGTPEMDDWGFGAIWGSNIGKGLPYQVFVMQKNTHEFKDSRGVEHPWTQRELIGAKLVPQLDEEWSLQFEGMGQVGRDGDGATLSGWSAYAGVNWKRATESVFKPFGKLGYHFMSGDDDAADESGGHSAWDPMWARGVNDSEMFLYGTHYGAAWWSNMHYVKATIGMDLGSHHRVTGSCGPLFAAAQDGMGGGDGMFKGFLSQARYDFPIWLADKSKGERFEVFGHVLAEFFNPGDYYETEKPGIFLRWQVEFKF